MKKQIAIITVGVSGSGKSFWADEYIKKNDHFKVVNRDDIRSELFPYLHNGNCKNYYKAPDFRDMEKKVTMVHSELIDRYIDEGFSVIISDTNLSSGFRKNLTQHLISRGVRVEYKIFREELQTCIERDNIRIRKVGKDVILNQYARLVRFLKNYEEEISTIRLKERNKHSKDLANKPKNNRKTIFGGL